MSQDASQQMLADSARSYVARGYGEQVRAASSAHEYGCSPERWQEFADLGWLALPLAEADGGLGGTLDEICTVAEELGRGAVVEPFVACCVLGAMLMADVAAPGVRASTLPDTASGKLRLAFAPWESGAGFDHHSIVTVARPCDQGFLLTGQKSLVPGGAGADAYLLAAKVGDGGHIALFLVPAAASGLAVQPLTLYDGQHAVRLQLDRVQVASVLLRGPAAEIAPLLDTALDRAIVASCAETVGTMQRAFDITLEYLKARKQFGRAIAANQVVQHRMVDLHVEIEEARALTRAAAEVFGPAAGDAAKRQRYSAAARACVAQAAKHVWEEAVQLHGAIGMTQEYAVGQLVRRLAVAQTLYGSADSHLERLAALSLDQAPNEPSKDSQ